MYSIECFVVICLILKYVITSSFRVLYTKIERCCIICVYSCVAVKLRESYQGATCRVL
jgi:hypothetical protein